MSDNPSPKKPVALARADAKRRETTDHQKHEPDHVGGFVSLVRLGLTLLCSPCTCSHPLARHEPLSPSLPALGFGRCTSEGCACTSYRASLPKPPENLENQ